MGADGLGDLELPSGFEDELRWLSMKASLPPLPLSDGVPWVVV